MSQHKQPAYQVALYCVCICIIHICKTRISQEQKCLCKFFSELLFSMCMSVLMVLLSDTTHLALTVPEPLNRMVRIMGRTENAPPSNGLVNRSCEGYSDSLKLSPGRSGGYANLVEWK